MAHIVDSVSRSFVTLKEMLVDRNIDVKALEAVSDAELVERITGAQGSIAVLEVNAELNVVYCMSSTAPKMPELRAVIGDSEGAEADGADAAAAGKSKAQYIVITKEPLQAILVKKVHTTDEFKHAQVQFFTLAELQFNISRHCLASKHTIVAEADVAEVMASYLVKSKSQFPNILKTDPMARYINAQPGDLVKIVRPSPSAGEYVSYRCCL